MLTPLYGGFGPGWPVPARGSALSPAGRSSPGLGQNNAVHHQRPDPKPSLAAVPMGRTGPPVWPKDQGGPAPGCAGPGPCPPQALSSPGAAIPLPSKRVGSRPRSLLTPGSGLPRLGISTVDLSE